MQVSIPPSFSQRPSIGEFLENVYHRQHLQSALDYLSPAEYESTLPLNAVHSLQRSQPSINLSLFLLSHSRGS